jgi:hypothetical protein
MPLPQLILLAFVLGLFVLLFDCCFMDRKGAESIRIFKAYLRQLHKKLSGNAPVDPDQERLLLEVLQNRIKVTNFAGKISGNPGLRYLYVKTYNLVAECELRNASENHVGWLRLNELMKGFYDMYFMHIRPVNPARSGDWRRSLLGRYIPGWHSHQF